MVSGAAFSTCMVVAISLVQMRTAPSVRGRVLSLVLLGFFGLYPVAYGLATLTAAALGARGIVAAGAGLMVLGGALALARPALRAAG